MAIVGYLSLTDSEINSSQEISMEKFGVDKLYKNNVGDFNNREPEKVIETLAKGDVFVIYKLDQIGRSSKSVFRIINLLGKRKINFVSISDDIDTRKDYGEFFFSIIICQIKLDNCSSSM